MAAATDEFDSIVMSDVMARQNGYAEGLEHGKKIGQEEGFSLGIQKGGELAKEILFYMGFCKTFIVICEQTARHKKHQQPGLLSLLKKTVSLVTQLTEMSPDDQNFSGILVKIRNNFKRTCAMLKVTAKYTEITSENNLTF